MSADILTLELVHSFLVEKGGKVKNHEAVRYFKSYLTDPASKSINRQKFKEFVNTLASTRTENDEKILILKPTYLDSPYPAFCPSSPQCQSPIDARNDPRNSLGIPLSPLTPSSSLVISPPRQPPPYRPPPPPAYVSTSSLDTMSIGSINDAPQAPPRRRESMRSPSVTEMSTPKRQLVDKEANNADDAGISVKERTQKFNRLASVEDELSPRHTPKSAEKENRRPKWGGNDEEFTSAVPLEPKKCMEWYVTASKGDYQELLRLVNQEPRLANKKDPFTAYTVLHWGAKYGNAEIIKIFAGKYKVNVNGKTNGGYTPLHISAQFGHKDLFKLMIEVYKADPNIRDYSGKTAEYYLLSKEQKESTSISARSEYGVIAKEKSLRHGKSRSKSFRHKTVTISAPTVLLANAVGLDLHSHKNLSGHYTVAK